MSPETLKCQRELWSGGGSGGDNVPISTLNEPTDPLNPQAPKRIVIKDDGDSGDNVTFSTLTEPSDPLNLQTPIVVEDGSNGDDNKIGLLLCHSHIELRL